MLKYKPVFLSFEHLVEMPFLKITILELRLLLLDYSANASKVNIEKNLFYYIS